MHFTFKLIISLLLLSFNLMRPALAQTPDFDYYNYRLDAAGSNEDIKTTTGELIYSYKSWYQIYDNKIVRFVQDDMDEHAETTADGEYTLTTNKGSKIKIKVVDNDIIDFQLLSDPIQFQATETKIDPQDYCYMLDFLIEGYNVTKRQNKQIITGYASTIPSEYNPQNLWDIWWLFYIAKDSKQQSNILAAVEVNGTDIGVQGKYGRYVYTWSDKKTNDIYPKHKFQLARGILESYNNTVDEHDPNVAIIINNCKVEYYNPKLIHFFQDININN